MSIVFSSSGSQFSITRLCDSRAIRSKVPPNSQKDNDAIFCKRAAYLPINSISSSSMTSKHCSGLSSRKHLGRRFQKGFFLIHLRGVLAQSNIPPAISIPASTTSSAESMIPSLPSR